MSYIEREAAIDCLHFVCVPQCRQYAQEEIKKIPAADVRPVCRGKWEKADCSYCVGFTEDGNSYTLPTVRCSVCKKLIAPVIWKNFCPNCGAMMEEYSIEP